MGLLRDPDARNDPPRPLLEHLAALRDMLVFGAVSWAVCVLATACVSNCVLEWMSLPIREFQEATAGSGDPALTSRLAAKGPLDGVLVCMSISMWGGSLLAFPAVMFAVLRFVFPALTRREKFALLSILSCGMAFFVAGVGLAYRQTLPAMLAALRKFDAWMNISDSCYFAADYIPVILKTLMAFGLAFQLPLAIFVLGWFGILSSAALRAKRRVAIVLAFVVSMFLTPPDPMSQIVMAVPLCLLYELSIWAVWLRERA